MNQVVVRNDGRVHTGYYTEKHFHVVYMECEGKVREVYFPTEADAVVFMKRIDVYGKLKVRLQ